MFKKENRLVNKKQINFLVKNGEIFRSPFFVVRYFFSKKETGKKMTIIISKKIFKSSVKRNRIKRIFREVLRRKIYKFDLFGGFIFFPNKNTLELKSNQIEEILENMFIILTKKQGTF